MICEQPTKEEVEKFLERVKEICEYGPNTIIVEDRDKNEEFKYEEGLTKELRWKIIKQIGLCDYRRKVEDDKNMGRFWYEFVVENYKRVHGEIIDLFIRMRYIRRGDIICLSLHPAEFKNKVFPFRNLK